MTQLKWRVQKFGDERLWVAYNSEGLAAWAHTNWRHVMVYAHHAARQQATPLYSRTPVNVAYAGYARRRADGTYQLFPRLRRTD